MQLLRQYIWILVPLMITGCNVHTFDPTSLMYDTSPFSQETQAKGNAHCTTLYSNAQFRHLKGKMPVMPGEIPTREMLSVATVPNNDEVKAIQNLESAVRNCRKLRAAAGVPTSATEDILAARLSKLRYGLYKGEIPYAVYNYGVAQAMRKNNTFMMAGEKAAQHGKVVGQQRQSQAELMADVNSLNSSIRNYNNDLNNFNRSIPSGTWFCKGPMCY